MRKFSVFIPLFLFCILCLGENGPVKVAGKWQVSWIGRIGTEQAVLALQQNGPDLTGTFQDLRGTSPLTGKVENNTLTFDVAFQGKKPFTIVFTGVLENGAIKGSSRSKEAGGYLGHGGEIVNPERPWTATRADDNAEQKLTSSSAKN